MFEKQPDDERINLILAVITNRVVDSGHAIQYGKKHYKMIDRFGFQAHYLKGTKALVIKAFDGRMYCSINDRDIYALEEIPLSEKKSKEFDTVYTPKKKEPKKPKIPDMNHPWRSRTFWKFVMYQQHHLMDNVEAYA